MSVEREIKIYEVGYAASFLAKFNELYKSGQLCDFIIVVGDKKIPVHRHVLIIKSEFFRAMLEHDTVENRRGSAVMKDVTFRPFKKAVDFIYSGKASIADEDIPEFMHVAYLLQLDELCEGIDNLLADDLVVESFYQTKMLADTYSAKSLGDKCVRFAFENFEAIAAREEFAELDEEYLELIISSKETKAAEVIKYKAFLKWISFDRQNRQTTFTKFLKCLVVSNIPSSYRRYIVENERMVYESNECLQIFLSSFFDTVHVEAKNMEIGCDNAIVGYNIKCNSFVVYSPKKQSWEALREVTAEIRKQFGFSNNAFTLAVLDRELYILHKEKAVFKLRYLDYKADWQKVAPLTMRHGSYPPVIVLGEKMYVIGVEGSMRDVSSERYDPDKDEWSEITFLNAFKRRQAYSVVVGGESIYCIGGWNGAMMSSGWGTASQVYNTVEKLDLSQLSWSEVAPMNHARHSAGAAALDGTIFVAGGSDGIQSMSSVESYDIASNIWTDIASMPGVLSPIGSVILEGNLFVIGDSKVERFDVGKGTWKSLKSTGTAANSKAGCFSLVY